MAADLIIRFIGDTRELSAKITETQARLAGLGKSSESVGSRLAGVGKFAAIGLGAAAVTVGTFAVDMADKYELAHARIETALKNSGTSWDAQRKAIDAVSQASVRFGYTRTDVENALAVMTTGMGSSRKAIQNFQLAEDLAAKTGKPLAEAALLVTRASEGQLRPLRALGIDLPVAAGGALKLQKAHDGLAKALSAAGLVEQKIHDGRLKGAAATDALRAAQDRVKVAQRGLNAVQGESSFILGELTKRLHGSAAASADTFGGKVKALEATAQNLGIQLGLVLIPILEKVAATTLSVVMWFEKHRTVATILAIAIGTVLVVAVGAYIVSMVAAAAATIAATWPILLIIAAIAAVGVAIYFLVTHWSQVWAAITNATRVAWTAIVHFFQLLPGRILGALQSVGQKLLSLFGTAFSVLAQKLPGFFRAAAQWYIALPIVIIGYLALFGARLVVWAWGAFASLVGALPGAAAALFGWWLALPGRIIGFLTSFAFRLVAWAGQAFAALVGALPGFLFGVAVFFGLLPSRIVGWIGDVGHILFDIGARIISGLLDGIKSAIGSVKNFLGGVASDIVSWKGPPDVDARILVGNGIRIMRGLQAGLAVGMGDVHKQLAGFTANISGKSSVHLNATTGAVRQIPFGRAPTSAPVYLQVIVDPVTGEQTVRQLQAHQRRNGPLPIKVAG